MTAAIGRQGGRAARNGSRGSSGSVLQARDAVAYDECMFLPPARHSGLALIATALSLAACGGGSRERDAANELRRARDAARVQVLAIEAQLTADAPRAAAYRVHEFLGDVPVLPGPVTTLEIVSRPATPDPARSDYPDCTAVLRCRRPETPDDADLLVVVLLFHARELSPAAAFATGARFTAQLLPWSDVPEAVRSIQRIDETDAFDLQLFAAIAPTAIAAQPAAAPSPAAPRIVATRPPDGSAPSQAESIANGVARIEQLVLRHGSFAQWYADLDPLRRELKDRRDAVAGPLFDGTRSALRNLSYVTHQPDEQWPAPQVAYFVALRDQLLELGIDLIVVPFPEQENLSALLLAAQPPADGIVFPYRLLWHLAVLRAGVEVVDLLPALIDASARFPNVFYDADDGHPANGGVVTAAAEIAARLRRYRDLPARVAEVAVHEQQHSIPTRYEKFPARAYASACYTASFVTRPDGSPIPRDVDDGPILLLGDSFINVPNSFGVTSGDLAAHLVKELGVGVRRLQIGGSAPQLMVHLARAGRARTRGVRVCVYLFREDYAFAHRLDETKYRWQVVDLPR